MPIAITSTFKPLTYDEITKPLIEQTKAQEELEDAYAAASTEAATLMSQANAQTDFRAYTRLKNYAEALQQNADALLQSGLNRNSRAGLLNTKRQYANEIIPVQAAIGRRNTLAEEQRKGKAEGRIYERDAATTSLDDIMDNPTWDYGNSVTRKELADETWKIANAVSEGIAQIQKGGTITPYVYELIKSSGLDVNEVMQMAARGDYGVYNEIVDSVLRAKGVADWSDTQAKAQARSAAEEGMYGLIGKKSSDTVTDQYNMQLALARAKEESKKETPGGGFTPAETTLLDADPRQGVVNAFLQAAASGGYGDNPLGLLHDLYGDSEDRKKYIKENTVSFNSNPSGRGFGAGEWRRISGNMYYKHRQGLDESITADMPSKEVYDALIDSGVDLSNPQNLTNSELADLAHNMSVQHVTTSVNFADMENQDTVLKAQAKWSADTLNGKIYKAEGEGTEPMKYKNIKDKKVVDIEFSYKYPDKLIVTFRGDDDDEPVRALMNPNAFNGNIAKAVENSKGTLEFYKQAMNGYNMSEAELEQLAQRNVANTLYLLFNGYAPNASKSSSKIN